MKYYVVKKGDIIFRQGQPAQSFFIVSTGMLEVLVDNNRVNIIGSG